MPLQNFLRCQNNKNNYNLVCETLQFLDCICGSTTGGLGLLGLYINEQNVALINQTVESLTEYCQGPCHENQVDTRARSHLHAPFRQQYALQYTGTRIKTHPRKRQEPEVPACSGKGEQI